MTWVFILVAITQGGIVSERVLLDNKALCVAYGRGYLSRSEMHRAQVRVAQCMELYSNEVVYLQND